MAYPYPNLTKQNLSALLLAFGLCCSSFTAGQTDSPDINRPWRPDFSGSWEKDYERSDRWENELSRQIQLIRRAQTRNGTGGNIGGGPSVQIGGGGRIDSSIVDLARLAEMISRQNVIEIDQNVHEVVIQREGDAALICGTREEAMRTFSSPYGSEICGWERQQLVFRITLPEEVEIFYRFSVSDDREWMNLLTTVSRRGRNPFSMIQVYRRFDMPGGGYNCRQTLSRGRVCSTESASELEASQTSQSQERMPETVQERSPNAQ